MFREHHRVTNTVGEAAGSLRAELAELGKQVERVRRRVERKQSHGLRNTMLVLAGVASRLPRCRCSARSFVVAIRAHDTELLAEDRRRGDRGRRAGEDGVQPVDTVRGVPAVHGRIDEVGKSTTHFSTGGRPSPASTRSGTRRSSSRSRTGGSRGSRSTASALAAPSSSNRSRPIAAASVAHELRAGGRGRRRPARRSACRTAVRAS